MKCLPHVNPLRLNSRTNLHTKIPPHTIIKISPTEAYHKPLHYQISVQPYMYPSISKENVCHFIHKTPKKGSSNLLLSCAISGNPFQVPHHVIGATPLVRHEINQVSALNLLVGDKHKTSSQRLMGP